MDNKKIQTIRRIAQVMSFFFFAGVFSQMLSGVQHIYQLIIRHNFSLDKMQMFLIPLALVIGLSVLFGRFFCGWLCAFGAFNDFLFAIAKKLFPRKQLRLSQTLDSYLKYLKYVVLAIVVLVWTFNLIATDSFDPWSAFARFGSIVQGGFSPAFLVLGLIGVGAMLIERFFCRYLCPLGAVLSLVAKIKLTMIYKPGAQCNSCKLCSASCPMSINLAGADKVNSGECISCLQCLSVCHRGNPRLNFLSKSFNTMTYVFAALILFLIINFKGRPAVSESVVIASSNAPTAVTTVNRSVAATNKTYNDGVYEGEATGFQPGLKVAVTVKNDKITAIKIISDHESQGFKEVPMQKIPQAIIKSQSTKVDAISGATFTSRGIMNAVENALSKAKVKAVSINAFATEPAVANRQSTAGTTNTAKAEIVLASVSEKTQTPATNKIYADGVYEGEADGYKPGLKVAVTVKNDKIAAITIVEDQETYRFKLKAVPAIPDAIIKAQSTKVDAVSGATFTSRGIMNAVENALNKAKIKTVI